MRAATRPASCGRTRGWSSPTSLVECSNRLTVLRRFQRLAEKAGLPRCRFHGLRHAHATGLLEAGVPIEVVSKRLRHADISTTLGLYHTTKKAGS